ncbi:Mut7-C RNAse domain-containing protein [Nocardiopsis potens]|uniref:Mut7-C RNAse domain-containing protein n=1 Tax=Nocardiopsis potens TaxID=1246458 RepID=UPI00059246FE|nr:Mut7-C RNAse domain-containing protein [Nocardiopsis potens]
MERREVVVRFSPELRFFLRPRHRGERVRAVCDAGAPLGHLVQSLGVPLTEVGVLRAGGRVVGAGYRPVPGRAVEVEGVSWPQPVPFARVRFLLDVHLGTLARRLRLLGVDTAYDNDRDDASLVRQAAAERRVLLTRDRGLLCRRALPAGGHVRAERPEEQLREVLGRFAPPLAPWTRCPACNGLLVRAAAEEVAAELEAGTRACYEVFGRCGGCGRVYWPGAHHGRLARIVREAEELVASVR